MKRFQINFGGQNFPRKKNMIHCKTCVVSTPGTAQTESKKIS